MRETWKKYAARINALQQRERAMIFAAVIAIIWFVLNALLIEPVSAQRAALDAQLQQRQGELQALQQQIHALETQADPDAANRARRDILSQQIAAANDELKNMQQNLVPAQKMNALLQDVLSRNPRLQLVAMRTLPVTALVEKQPDAAPTPNAAANPMTGQENIFRHGVEITLQGNYVDLYDYLMRLEKLPWRMFWARAVLDAGDYPRLTLKLTIYTLSLDKAWLEV